MSLERHMVGNEESLCLECGVPVAPPADYCGKCDEREAVRCKLIARHPKYAAEIYDGEWDATPAFRKARAEHLAAGVAGETATGNIIDEAAEFLARPVEPSSGHFKDAAQIVERHGLSPSHPFTHERG